MSIVSRLVSAARSLIVAFAAVLARVVGGGGAPAGARASRSAAAFAGVLVAICCVLPAGASPAFADSCPNAQFRYGYGAYLPDCRAYEQATPVDKGGGDVTGSPDEVQAAANGGGVTFSDLAGVPGVPGSTGAPPLYIATRGPDGWLTHNVMPPASASWSSVSPFGWSGDLAKTFTFGSLSASQRFAVVVGDPASGSFQVLATGSNGPGLASFSADDSQVLFEDQGQLLPTAASGRDNVYEYDLRSGSLVLAGVLPDGTTPAGGSFAGPYDWAIANPGSGGALRFYYTKNTLSADGPKVFFTAAADAGHDAGTDQVFVRENPTSASATTVQVSASQKTNGAGPGGTDASGPRPAAWMASTPDGSHVLFTSPEELTNDANTGSADQGNDLYEWNGGALTDVSLPNAGVTNGDPNGAEVQGVLGVSDDGSYIYFVANGVLAAGASPGNCNGNSSRGLANSGTCNLYVWHAGTISFIAQLDANQKTGLSDEDNWLPNLSGGTVAKASRVTANGQTLLFTSQAPLTGYDNNGFFELYRYSAATGQLGCVSCDPSGLAATGSATLRSIRSLLSDGTAAVLTRNLSASGDQVFFESPDPLVARDTNGSGGCPLVDNVPSCQDVYEWEADGAGSCQSSAQNGGCLYLISTGESQDPSYFADASASGDDAFFFTSQPLVGQDQDQLVDVYDARVDGGLASQNPPAPPSPCSGDACKGPASSAPATPTAASMSFTGPGDLASAPTAPPPGRVRVLSRVVHGATFLVRVQVPGKGRITVTAAGIKTARKSISKAGTYSLRMALTAKEKKVLKHKRKLKPELHVTFLPAGGTASSITFSITDKA